MKQQLKRLGIGLAGLVLLFVLTSGLAPSAASANSKPCGGIVKKIFSLNEGPPFYKAKVLITSGNVACSEARKVIWKSLKPGGFNGVLNGWRCASEGAYDPHIEKCEREDPRRVIKSSKPKPCRSCHRNVKREPLNETFARQGSACSAIKTRQQYQHANAAIAAEEVKELVGWGQFNIKLRALARKGSLVTLGLRHAKHGNSHLAFNFGCPAVLEISHSKLRYTCEPEPSVMRIVCKKRWEFMNFKTRTVRLNRAFKIRVHGRDHAVDVRVSVPNLLIPGRYVLDGFGGTNELRFIGG